jgi:hypothetical protein
MEKKKKKLGEHAKRMKAINSKKIIPGSFVLFMFFCMSVFLGRHKTQAKHRSRKKLLIDLSGSNEKEEQKAGLRDVLENTNVGRETLEDVKRKDRSLFAKYSGPIIYSVS